MDKNPIQRQIYFLALVKSLEMIFPQYTEICEVLIDYPKIGWESIKYFAKKAIRNIFHTNIYVHSRIFIAELPGHGIKRIDKLQSHCANMDFF